MASSNAARRLPSEKGPTVVEQPKEQSRIANLKGHGFKPGQSGNPNGRPKGSTTRELIVRSFFDLLLQKAHGADVPYLEVMMQKVMQSEHLLSKFLDKLLPSMTTDQTSLVFNNFESILAQVNAQRSALGVVQSPPPLPVVDMTTPEPELEPLTRKGGG
jgi:hypothetical protein